MIQHVKIHNYKSVRELDLTCKRFNVFIGDTSTGKSNVLEALTLLSQGVMRGPDLAFDNRIIRYERLNELFTHADADMPLIVEADGAALLAMYVPGKDRFEFTIRDVKGTEATFNYKAAGTKIDGPMIEGNLETTIRRYQYDPAVVFGTHWYTHLAPPDGQNFPAVLLKNAELLAEIDEIMSAKGIHISIDRDSYKTTQRIDLARNVAVHLSWGTISETIRRYVFLYAAVRSNVQATLLLDEPEQSTFPFYTAHIAEVMAREATNQYFITTHNQYLLSALVDKVPTGELQVLATYRKNGMTAVRAIPPEELEELMQYDVFLNLDKLAEA